MLKKIIFVLIVAVITYLLIHLYAPDNTTTVETPQIVQETEEVLEETAETTEETVEEEIVEELVNESEDILVEQENETVTCTAEWQCVNDTRKYQNESCGFQFIEECEFGCENTSCLPEPEVVEEEEEIETITAGGVIVIKTGETQRVLVGGEEHNITLRLLDFNYALMSVDGHNLDEMYLNESTNASGITLNIETIFFQPYVGGTQEVHYTVE